MDLKEYIQVMSADFQRHPWELTRLRILRFFITNSHSKTSILDIGSGDGFLATGISKYFPSSSIIAVDINYEDDVLSAFNNNKPQNLSFQKNLTGFPEQKEIDIIILMDVLEHIEPSNIMLVLKKLHASLKSGGRLIISVPINEGLEEMLLIGHNPNAHTRIYSPDLIKSELVISGFTIKSEKHIYAFRNQYYLKSLISKFVPGIKKPNGIIISAIKP